jgi:hypothetical protein
MHETFETVTFIRFVVALGYRTKCWDKSFAIDHSWFLCLSQNLGFPHEIVWLFSTAIRQQVLLSHWSFQGFCVFCRIWLLACIVVTEVYEITSMKQVLFSHRSCQGFGSILQNLAIWPNCWILVCFLHPTAAKSYFSHWHFRGLLFTQKSLLARIL